MTLEEAIKHANSHSRNINIQWFVCEWNDGYIVHSTSYMLRHLNVKSVYSTGPLNKNWRVYYDETEKTFKHIVK